MHNFILGRKEKSKETQVTVELKEKKKTLPINRKNS